MDGNGEVGGKINAKTAVEDDRDKWTRAFIRSGGGKGNSFFKM